VEDGVGDGVHKRSERAVLCPEVGELIQEASERVPDRVLGLVWILERAGGRRRG
jgi:hypothetical protein